MAHTLEISEQISDVEIAEIFGDPYIAARVANDEFPSGPFAVSGLQYVAAKVDGKTVGAYAAIIKPDNQIEMHSLLRKEALPHSRSLGRVALDWAFGKKGAALVYTTIDCRYKSVINYCRKMGLEAAGILNRALPKGGEMFDVAVMCISRERWKKWAV